MAMPAKDLTGQKFGYLIVIGRAGSTSKGRTKRATWTCQCECGNVVVRVSQYLRTKWRTQPRSCGCHHGNERHRMTNTPLFNVWAKMKHRCVNPEDKDWANYGGRGIFVCETWLEAFEAFYADMHAGYAPGLTLGRVDNDGPYAPWNCRWETPRQQSNNKRNNKFVDTPKGRMTVSEAARAYGLKVVTLEARLNRYKWPLMRALTEPTTYSTAGRAHSSLSVEHTGAQ